LTKEYPDYIWFNGKLVPFNEAKLHVLTPTCLYGINVFEGIRGYWNDEAKELYCFRLDDHYKRLYESAKIMRFNVQYTKNDLTGALLNLLKINNIKEDVQIRHSIYLDGFGSWHSTDPIGMFISCKPSGRSYGGKKSISCCISSWERINDRSISPRIKAGSNYQNSRMAQMDAIVNGYDSTIIMNKNGKVAEGPGSCIFIFRDNKLITPPITSSILESITRDTILSLAEKELNLQVQERDIDRTELYVAQELFFCGTAVEIMPITSVDRIVIGDGEPGPITNALMQKFFQIVRGKVKEYNKWLTPTYGN